MGTLVSADQHLRSVVATLIVLGLAVIPVLALGVAARGDGTPSIQFLDDHDLVLVVGPGTEKASATVVVVVTTPTPSPSSLPPSPPDVAAELPVMTDPSGRPAPSGLVDITKASDTSDSKQTYDVTAKDVGAPGTYTGRLIFSSDDGTIIRKTLNVVVRPAAGVTALDPASVTDLTVIGKAWFSPTGWGSPSFSPDLTAPPTEGATVQVGQVAGEEGVGRVVVRDGAIQVEGIEKAGTYTGSFDLQPGADTGSVKLSVKVKDRVWVPGIVLALGLLAGTAIDVLARVRRPRTRLAVQLANLKAQAEKLQSGEKTRRAHEFPELPGTDYARDVHRIYEAVDGKEQGALADAAQEAMVAMKRADSDTERAKWGPDGDSFKHVADLVGKLPDMYKTARQVADAWQSLLRLADTYGDDPTRLLQLPIGTSVTDTLHPRLLLSDSAPNQDTFTAWQKQVADTKAFVDAFLALYKVLDELHRAEPTDPRPASLRALLMHPNVTSVADVTRLAKRVEEESRDDVRALLGSAAFVEMVDRPRATGRTVVGLHDLLSWMEADARRSEAVQPPTAKPPPTETELRTQLRRADRVVLVALSLIAFLTGIQAVYVANATFGASADYISIFVWGTGVDSGLKLIRRLGPGLAGRFSAS
jgi:hypothetical protein